jgi:hypothetical protein
VPIHRFMVENYRLVVYREVAPNQRSYCYARGRLFSTYHNYPLTCTTKILQVHHYFFPFGSLCTPIQPFPQDVRPVPQASLLHKCLSLGPVTLPRIFSFFGVSGAVCKPMILSLPFSKRLHLVNKPPPEGFT